MISYLKGQIVQRTPTEIVIEVNGVGYAVIVPLSTSEKLAHITGTVTLLTHLHVREDALQLYGFATDAERELFRALIGVSGVGPKIAQGILSGMGTEQIREAIIQNNASALTSISGVGKKTAERIIIELRDKLGKSEMIQTSAPTTSKHLRTRSEAVIALMSLGHSRQNAESAVIKILGEPVNRDIPVEELVRRALQIAVK
ncbi:MAG TPA: Holliday junction branch migration protein RuvA [Bacteroidota bacterium]|nr:Holliday junction branch migration protein RuvA [Bacteroidota bacterium]